MDADTKDIGGNSDNKIAGAVRGPVVQAGRIDHVTMMSPLTEEPPFQLPPDPRFFVNRTSELAQVTELVNRSYAQSQQTIAVLSGLGGVGKTAVGIRWATEHRDEFRDGQLYADLDGYRSRGGVEIADVLGAFLRALGVHEQHIPARLADRAALYRARTVGRRLLVLIDNVQQAAQVRPLLPGSAASASRSTR